jgi:catechol 2,3-dioxygenase-like lactoylglutathione lyase family enzyme
MSVNFISHAVALALLPQAAAQTAAPAGDRAGLVNLVVAVQDADYRGDLPRLRSLAADMGRYTTDPALAGAARYWRGFAHWRHALNSLNDGAPGDSADADFAAAIVEFRKALALDSTDVEAQIGLAAGLSNRAFFNIRNQARAKEFLAEVQPIYQKLKARAPDNPRAMFVLAPSLFYVPSDRGGGQQQALALLERGIGIAESLPPARDSLAPSWGLAELHMLSGWFALNLNPPDGATALRHAETALTLRPTWRYVRAILLPQIRRQTETRVTTVAYRVHRMPAMLAFYTEAFGVRFREVETGGGIKSRFGELSGITLKFVPIRDSVEFEEFPIHQLGIEVPDVEAVMAAARKHGGRVQDEPARRDGRLQAAIRDPDGNTLELYGPR